jgi:hypothetical protein
MLGAFHLVTLRLEGGSEETLQYSSAQEAERVAKALTWLARPAELTLEKGSAAHALSAPRLGWVYALSGVLLVGFGLVLGGEAWRELGPSVPQDRAEYSSLEALKRQQSGRAEPPSVPVYGRLAPHPALLSGLLLWEEERRVRSLVPGAPERWEVTERNVVPSMVIVKGGVVSLTRGGHALSDAPVVSENGERRRRGFQVAEAVRVLCERLSAGESESELLCEPVAMYGNPPKPPRRGDLAMLVLGVVLMVPVGLRLLPLALRG